VGPVEDERLADAALAHSDDLRGASVVCGLALPRLEQAYLASYAFGLSVGSAQAWLSAVASGMMALTGVVFAMAFVMVQFGARADGRQRLGLAPEQAP
jgi:uncharacterized membrane protein